MDITESKMVPITSIEDLCEKLFMTLNARVKSITFPNGFRDWVAVKTFVDGLAEFESILYEEQKQLGTDIRMLFQVLESLKNVDKEYFNNFFKASFDPEHIVVVISISRGYTLSNFGRHFRKLRSRRDDKTNYEDKDYVSVSSVDEDNQDEVESEADENDPDYDQLKNNDTVLDPKNFFANLGIKCMAKVFKPFIGMEFVRNDFKMMGSMTTQSPSLLDSIRDRVLLSGKVIFRDSYYIKYVDPNPDDVRVWSNRAFSSCLGSGGKWKTTGDTAGKIEKAFDKLDMDEYIRVKRLERLRDYRLKISRATTKHVDVTIEDGPLKGSLIRITKTFNSRQFYLGFVSPKN